MAIITKSPNTMTWVNTKVGSNCVGARVKLVVAMAIHRQVTVQPACSKHRRRDIPPLDPELVTHVRELTCARDLNAPLFPKTRKAPDEVFRRQLREHPTAIRWIDLYQVIDDEDVVRNTPSVCQDEMVNKEGYRLYW